MNPGSHFTEVPTPNQVNNYDCGVYVMAITHLMAGRLKEWGEVPLTETPRDLSFWRMEGAIDPDFITKTRMDVCDIIKEEIEKRESNDLRLSG